MSAWLNWTGWSVLGIQRYYLHTKGDMQGLNVCLQAVRDA